MMESCSFLPGVRPGNPSNVTEDGSCDPGTLGAWDPGPAGQVRPRGSSNPRQKSAGRSVSKSQNSYAGADFQDLPHASLWQSSHDWKEVQVLTGMMTLSIHIIGCITSSHIRQRQRMKHKKPQWQCLDLLQAGTTICSGRLMRRHIALRDRGNV